MLIPLYPPGHPKENTRKADKDWTAQEKADFEAAKERDRTLRAYSAAMIVSEYEEARRTLGR